MGLLDGVLGSVLGQGLGGLLGENTQHASLAQNLISMLTAPNGGGLGGLLGQLQSAGLGQAVGSWISTGANQPVTGQQLQDALPADLLAQLAAKAGIDPSQVSSGLAQVLPSLVDHLSPNGSLPQGNGLQDALGGLGKMLGGA